MFASGPIQELNDFATTSGGVKPMIRESCLRNSTLVSKKQNSSTLRRSAQELVASDALPDSLVTYLVLPDFSKRIIYVSSTLQLRSLLYNEDSANWIIDNAFRSHKVHTSGKLAGAISENGDQHIFFQDPSGRLIHLRNNSAPTPLSVNVATGSPLTVLLFNEKIHLFYISNDNHIHYLTQKSNGTWRDSNFAHLTLETDEIPKRFIASPDANNALELFVLTGNKTIFRISANGGRTTLGMMGHAGERKPTKEECFLIFALRGWVYYGHRDVRRQPRSYISHRAGPPTTKHH